MNSVPKIILEGIETGRRLPPDYPFSDAELTFLANQRLVSSLISPDTQASSALRLLDSQKQQHKAIVAITRELSSRIGTAARYAIIKGLSFERCIYGSSQRRDMSDIDILVRPSDIGVMHKTLLSMGYQQQTGPSSMGSADASSRALAAIRASQNTRDLALDGPVRRHPFKGELSPYVRHSSPTIEVHDSFRSLPDEYLNHLINAATLSSLRLITDPLDILVLLIVTTYDNSESLFSNCFDHKICLRDYFDLASFFRKYSNQLSQNIVSSAISALGLQAKAKKVAENLHYLYPTNEFALLRNPNANSLNPIDRYSFINRIVDADIARKHGLHCLRKKLLEISSSRPLGTAQGNSKHNQGNRSGIAFESDGDSTTATLNIPASLLKNDELLQLAIYPLDSSVNIAAFKIDLIENSGNCTVFARASKRLLSGATLRKENGAERPVSRISSAEGDFWNISVSAPFAPPFCAELNLYEHHHSNVYWLSGDPKWLVDDDLAFGDVHFIRNDYQTSEIEMSECICRVTTNSPEDAEQIAKLFPNASEGRLQARCDKQLYSYALFKTAKGYSLSLENQFLVRNETACNAYAIFMDEIEKRIVHEAHDSVLAAHAATVLTEDGCILLMGKSGSGKSSLASTLSMSTVVLGDECALVNMESGEARCENYPLNIKQQNSDLLARMKNQTPLKVNSAEHGFTFYFPLKWSCSMSFPIKAIVIPSYSSDNPKTQLRKKPYVECSQSILSSLIGEQSQSVIFAAFSSMLASQNIELFELEFADVEAAALTLLNKFEIRKEIENARTDS